MILERLYDDMLAQASYLIASDHSPDAIVIDPLRDVERYVALAARKQLRIAYVAETHIHADFVSGARELAASTGATLLLSGHGEGEWTYRTSGRVVRDGACIELGDVTLEVRHTPGHTAEHIAFIVTDRAATDQPIGMVSGDFIFVGDVGRPDLLEHAANARGTANALARKLFHSIHATAALPDHLQIWPGHGAGSACGRALGALPATTLGYERLANWAFQARDEGEFVRAVLEGQPEIPPYFARMKVANRDGAPPRNDSPLAVLDLDAFREVVGAGAVAVDCRGSAAFAAGHIPGVLHLPLGSSFVTWAGWLVPYDRDVVLLADDVDRAERARRALSLIGIDRVIGMGGEKVRDAWRATVGPLERVTQVDVASIARAEHREIVDVRSGAEWKTGHIPEARHIFLGAMLEGIRDLPRDTPIALHCGSGTRSSIAASIMQAHGFTDVANVIGGFHAWEAAGLPIESEG